MTKYIPLDVLIDKIEKLNRKFTNTDNEDYAEGFHYCLELLSSFINTIKIKDIDLEKERAEECPFRQVGCTMYEDKVLECKGACSWVVDYHKLKELKAQKGEKV